MLNITLGSTVSFRVTVKSAGVGLWQRGSQLSVASEGCERGVVIDSKYREGLYILQEGLLRFLFNTLKE